MTKPKPIPPSVTNSIKATEEAETLRKRLDALLTLSKNGPTIGTQSISEIQDDEEHDTEDLDRANDQEDSGVQFNDEEGQGKEPNEGEGDYTEDKSLNDETEDEYLSEEDYNAKIRQRSDNHSPFEVIGVHTQTAEIIQHAFNIYHQEAFDWIDLYIEQHPPSSQAIEAAERAYPWIVRTLASYESFKSQDGRLIHLGTSSFPKALLRKNPSGQERFKILHSIAFSLNPKLADAYVSQAESDPGSGNSYIPTERLTACLQPVTAKSGIYGFCWNQTSGTFYIGRSKHIARRLGNHLSTTAGLKRSGVNRFVRAAQESASYPLDWIRGSLISVQAPQAILSALETSVIACHGSAVVRPGQSQHNIVDQLFLPRPPIEDLPTLYNQYKAGMSFEDLGELHNVNAWYLKELISGSPPTVRSLRNKPNTRQDFLSLLHLKLAGHADVRIRFPRIASIQQQSSANAKDEASQYTYAMRTRSKNERWTLKDHMVERNDPFERADNIERIGTATRDDYGDSDDEDSMAMAIEIPVAEYRQRVVQAYMQALVQELEAM